MRFWTGAGARVRGRDHIRFGDPCQDNVRTEFRRGVACAALADGAGSRPLSHLGSECAVRAATSLLVRHFDVLVETSADKAKALCCEAIRRETGKKAQKLGVSPGELATTVLVIAVRGGRYIGCHIGDGVIVRVGSAGEEVLSLPQGGEFANQTAFITDRQALTNFRFYRGRIAEGDQGFVLMSDGAAQSLFRRRDGFVAPACRSMVRWLADVTGRDVSRALKDNLRQRLSTRTGDDCSLALLGAVTLSFEDLRNLPPGRRMELFGTRNRRYAFNHIDFLTDLFENCREGDTLRGCAARLGVSEKTIRRHAVRAEWECLPPPAR